MKLPSKTRSGFTLIEMTVVLFIISLLILIILPNISRSRQHAMEIHGRAMVSVVKTQANAYVDNENQSEVTWPKLIDSQYLSKDQVSKAQKYGIDIQHNEITENGKEVENINEH